VPRLGDPQPPASVISATGIDDLTLLTLDRDQLIDGVAVSGTVELSPSSTPIDGQAALATPTVKTAGVPAVAASERDEPINVRLSR
jgi:hypothetical protein